jgi:hypothetical protein
MSRGGSQEDNDSHVYFITVLEIILQILKPFAEKSPTSSIEEGSQPPVDPLVNIFEALDLEEPSCTSPTSSKPSRKSAQKQPKKTYDIESALDDILVSLMLFF